MENKTFTISVYSENNLGLLNRISGILKRHINIISLNVQNQRLKMFLSSLLWFILQKMGSKYCRSNRKQIEVIKTFLS
jgi:acetolactate synthase-1/3 small subunit